MLNQAVTDIKAADVTAKNEVASRSDAERVRHVVYASQVFNI